MIVKKLGKFVRTKIQDLSEKQAGVGTLCIIVLIIILGAS
jgi:hypothetical protein